MARRGMFLPANPHRAPQKLTVDRHDRPHHNRALCGCTHQFFEWSSHDFFASPSLARFGRSARLRPLGRSCGREQERSPVAGGIQRDEPDRYR